MESIARVASRIEAIQNQLGANPGRFSAALAAAEQGTGSPSSHAFMSSPFVSAPGQMTFGSMLGGMLGASGFLPVQLPPAAGVASRGQLAAYLDSVEARSRNGHLGESDLVPISGAWDDRPARLLPPAAAAWEEMRSAAAADGVDLRTIDTYRSWDAQAAGHEKYLNGQKSAYVAPPGHSEHGVGLAVDVTNGSLVGPGNREWEWLRSNAGRYGWYPISNESWHWEFRGV